MEPQNQEELKMVNDFDKMKLKDKLLRGIYAYGFQKPSLIQSRAIIPITEGKDIVAQSQSGTGKTGTFVISSLQRIDENISGCQCIIISPTRELAYQILNVMKHIGQYTKIEGVLCVGGTKLEECKKRLSVKKPYIAIGTPGRIIDVITRRWLRVEKLKMMVLDEADEMLRRSFKEQIRTIIQQIPKETQICLFSATMPKEVLEITEHFLQNPIFTLIEKENLTLDGITQFYINVGVERYKFDTLCDIYKIISMGQSMIYVNSKNTAKWLQEQLQLEHFTVSVIHSDMKSSERTEIMKDFRKGKTRILLSTDLLARGIDIQEVSIVINYNLPYDRECYIHRIGRSGRFGRKGVAINLVTNRTMRFIDDLSNYYKTTIEPMPENISSFL